MSDLYKCLMDQHRSTDFTKYLYILNIIITITFIYYGFERQIPMVVILMLFLNSDLKTEY